MTTVKDVSTRVEVESWTQCQGPPRITYLKREANNSPDAARDDVLRASYEEVAGLGKDLDAAEDGNQPGSVRSPCPVLSEALSVDVFGEANDVGRLCDGGLALQPFEIAPLALAQACTKLRYGLAQPDLRLQPGRLSERIRHGPGWSCVTSARWAVTTRKQSKLVAFTACTAVFGILMGDRFMSRKGKKLKNCARRWSRWRSPPFSPCFARENASREHCADTASNTPVHKTAGQ